MAAMAETSFSAIEHALENQRLGGLQIRVAAICGLIQMCDGYDVGSIGWSVPSLTHAWHIAPPAFALVTICPTWMRSPRVRRTATAFYACSPTSTPRRIACGSRARTSM